MMSLKQLLPVVFSQKVRKHLQNCIFIQGESYRKDGRSNIARLSSEWVSLLNPRHCQALRLVCSANNEHDRMHVCCVPVGNYKIIYHYFKPHQ